MNARPSWNQQRFDDLLLRGVAAAKAGQRREARNFLEAAVKLNRMDARPWLWLAATSDDPAEQRGCLEEALAIEPTNQAARRGLVALSGRLAEGELRPIGAAVLHEAPAAPAPARSRAFGCPQCGGLTRYVPEQGATRCERCATLAPVAQHPHASDRHERPLDFVLPTERAQRWAAAAHTLACQGCGARCVLPPEQHTARCAFCGSDYLLASPHTEALIPPQALVPLAVDERAAHEQLDRWLDSGWFTPGDLTREVRHVTLRAAYYPIWSFDAAFNARWWAMVEVRDDRWERREGESTLFFDDVLVPGSRQLPLEALQSVEPFDLTRQVAFQEAFLAGWPAFLPDLSLADASIAARGVMAARARPLLEERVLLDKNKRDFTVIPQGLSDPSYRHLLLPLWVGQFHYRGQGYRVVINGQTGKVGGQKPKDETKVALAVALALLLALAAAAALLFLVMR